MVNDRVFANSLTTRLENAEIIGVSRALFKWLVSGDNLETAIVVVAVGKFALSGRNSFTFVCPQHGSLLVAAGKAPRELHDLENVGQLPQGDPGRLG